MFDYFKQLFRNKGFSEDQIKKFTGDFYAVALLDLWKAFEDKLTSEENEILATNLKNEDWKAFEDILAAKHSKEELQSIIKERIPPLLESYLKTVTG